jgi:hypothetical protein
VPWAPTQSPRSRSRGLSAPAAAVVGATIVGATVTTASSRSTQASRSEPSSLADRNRTSVASPSTRMASAVPRIASSPDAVRSAISKVRPHGNRPGKRSAPRSMPALTTCKSAVASAKRVLTVTSTAGTRIGPS